MSQKEIQHVFIVGAKGVSQYGGFETFVDKLTEYHQNNEKIKYHIACKANGNGCMSSNDLADITWFSDTEFIYHNSRCFKVSVPNIGSAQAIYYDVKALYKCCKYIEEHQIAHPIVYILACRIGPFAAYYYRRIQRLGGRLFINPDGHEWMRAKWSKPIRKYWKVSEQLMVRHSDLVICDSINIEKYIHECYDGKGFGGRNPKTTFIAYGADLSFSKLKDNAPELTDWYKKNGISMKEYYLIVGRLVPENSFDIMIQEFMNSNSKRKLVIIATANDKYLKHLEEKLHFKKDKRIKFVGTVYNQELLKKIRENAYAYLHGHTVGGTNPSLIEALGSTEINLLIDVGFNKEVAENCALYWSRKKGSLASLINWVDKLNETDATELGNRAKERVKKEYTWKKICDMYEAQFIHGKE